jgi:uncharacterized protein (DUF488 family)
MTTHSTVYTIGHGSESFDAFLDRLQPHRVTTIADVRSHPVSRHAPDFAKRALEEATASAGIGYRWLGGELGGRPQDRGLYDAAGGVRWDDLAATAGFANGVGQLVGLARTSTIVVMCSEVDPRRCHRSLIISPALLDAGLDVLDILGDGTVAPHQPTLG